MGFTVESMTAARPPYSVEELEGFKQILKMYLLHSCRRLEAGTSITKGYERSPSA